MRRPLVWYFLAASLRCQAGGVTGVTGNTLAQRRRDTIRATAANQTRPADSYRTRPTLPSQRCILMPEHQHLDRSLAAA